MFRTGARVDGEVKGHVCVIPFEGGPDIARQRDFRLDPGAPVQIVHELLPYPLVIDARRRYRNKDSDIADPPGIGLINRNEQIEQDGIFNSREL